MSPDGMSFQPVSPVAGPVFVPSALPLKTFFGLLAPIRSGLSDICLESLFILQPGNTAVAQLLFLKLDIISNTSKFGSRLPAVLETPEPGIPMAVSLSSRRTLNRQ